MRYIGGDLNTYGACCQGDPKTLIPGSGTPSTERVYGLPVRSTLRTQKRIKKQKHKDFVYRVSNRSLVSA